MHPARGANGLSTEESVRACEPEELTEMFETAGLVIESTRGDFGSRPVGPDCSRLILLARKP